MEDATCVDDTLALYRALRGAGLDNVGIVLQAYLKRTLADIADLRDLRPSVRLCKGIYVEPASIAFQDAEVVRRSFVSSLEALLEAARASAIATHDECCRRVARAGRGARAATRYEFQMLLGVRESRADELVAAGHPLRVYVPFGQRWYEYSLRRLQENPQMAGVIAKATVARAIGRSLWRRERPDLSSPARPSRRLRRSLRRSRRREPALRADPECALARARARPGRADRGMHVFHALAVPASVALLVGGFYLHRRRHVAWQVAFALLCGLAVLDIAKGLDIEEAALSAAGAALLWWGRDAFTVRGDPVRLAVGGLARARARAATFVVAVAAVAIAEPHVVRAIG